MSERTIATYYIGFEKIDIVECCDNGELTHYDVFKDSECVNLGEPFHKIPSYEEVSDLFCNPKKQVKIWLRLGAIVEISVAKDLVENPERNFTEDELKEITASIKQKIQNNEFVINGNCYVPSEEEPFYSDIEFEIDCTN